MDSSSTMLWNFEEGIGESDLLGTSSAGSESDPLSILLTSINRTATTQSHSVATGNCDNSMLDDGNHSGAIGLGNISNVASAENVINKNTQALTELPHRLPANSLLCSDQIGVKCFICLEAFRQPKVLACFHSFCKCCLERQLINRDFSETEGSEFVKQRQKHQSQLLQHQRNEEDEDPPGQILVCPICHVETQLSFQLGIDGLLSDYGLMNAVNARKRFISANTNKINNEDKNGMLIFGSLSSTSSSPPLDDVCNQNTTGIGIRSTASCTCCKSGELASAFCNTCSHFLCVNCTFAHRYMLCFEGHRVEDLLLNVVNSVVVSSGASSGIGSSRASGGDNSNGTSPPTQNVAPASVTEAAIVSVTYTTVNSEHIDSTGANANQIGVINNDASSHCKCLEHRSQPLRFFCLSCNLAICRDCTLGEHVAPTHNVETIDNVAEKQIGMMEALINEARNKQSELHEIFRLIDTDQNRLNLSFQQAQSNVDESANCLIELIQEARRTLSKDLENAFGYKQLQLTIIDKEVQKMTKKMSQTIEFTQRLLKYSSPTEVMVFKPLLDSRIQGFLNFNADTSNFLHNSCEIETQSLNPTQARQVIFSLMSNIQLGANARTTTTASVVGPGASHSSNSWSDAANAVLTAVSHTNHDQSQQRQMRIGSASPTSMLLHHRNQSFSTTADSNNMINIIAPIGRPLSRQQQKVRSSPPVGSLGTRLGASHFDNSFAAALSDTNLTHQDFGSSHSLNAGSGLLCSSLGNNNNKVGIPINNSHLLASEVGGLTVGASALAGATNFLSQQLDNSSLDSLVNNTSASAGAASNMASIFNQYEKWSSGLDPSSLGALSLSDPDTITDLSILANAQLGGDKLSSALGANSAAAAAFQLYPPRSQIKRQKMTYHCKFGEFGVMEGQFTEPSGVAVNAQNDIIVADTNNHRIQVFDKEGRFKFQFGECGKRDGQLLYPNRVSVNRVTGDFIVTERSPTHQIQIYNQYGNFVRKFGANILQHPRGVCVDNQGRIIVVECKVMRVIIFDAYGNVIHKFSCSRYLEFPNGVCTNEKNEILISDNRAHCIKVFNYEGHYVRQIGGEGITNYPIGVGINALGEVIVADNHNNFNLTVFNQDGTMLNALESKVKHAQCFDVALVENGSVVLASKDYRLYLYRYQSQTSQQQLGL